MEICRSCLAESIEPIFVSLLSVDMQSKYAELTSIIVDSNDPITTQICLTCQETLSLFNQFKERCIDSNQYLKESIVSIKEEDYNAYEDLETIPDSMIVVKEEKHTPKIRTRKRKIQENKTQPGSKRLKVAKHSKTEDDIQENSIDNVAETSHFQCVHCPRRFQKRLAFKKHVESHSIKKTFMCDDCGRVLSGLQNLKIHKRHMHMNLRPFDCETCGMAFKTKASMIEHIALKHIKERKFNCKICTSSFKSQKSLKSHISDVHLREKTHKCTQCELAFKTRFVLATHFQNVHTNFRPFICELCNRAFGLLNSLQKHMKTHKDGKIRIRNFKCGDCGKLFLSKETLRDHCRKFHKPDCPEVVKRAVVTEKILECLRSDGRQIYVSDD